MPWWLLGISMVATTFSTDTPNLVTDIVRTNGVSGNWVWWVFLLTGLLTVFVYAKLWRRSDVSTDMEFYELRYSGKAGKFLRSFRSVYLGVIFNILAMSGVTLAAIKIGAIMLGLSAIETIFCAGGVTLIFSAFGGFRGVVYTEFILFFTAMAGSIGAAIYLVNLPEVGGMDSILNNQNLSNKISIFGSSNIDYSSLNVEFINQYIKGKSLWNFDFEINLSNFDNNLYKVSSNLVGSEMNFPYLFTKKNQNTHQLNLSLIHI